MIRVFIFFALLFAVTLGFAWMADLPGVISVSWNGYVWEQPPVIVAVVAGLFLVAFLVVVGLIRLVLNSPKLTGRFFTRRRKDKGYAALSQGMVALATGNAKLARRHGLDADKLLNNEPATKLLLAQTAQLAGKDDEARGRFEAMLEDSDTRALGLHGLFVEAERHREPVAARHYAEEAAKLSPNLEWANRAVLGYQAIAHDWESALVTLERNYTAKQMDKKTYRRHRAVILTALARDLEDGSPDKAFSLAKEAHGLALDLVPAAVIASRLATRRGDVRKAGKVIEATWRLSPHPDLAEAYAHVRTGDSAVDRLKRVTALSAQRANTAVGALAIARTAMDAREFEEARAQLKKVLQSEPTRGAFVLMAELEEAEHGDRGRMRDWLARAVRAPMDKAWVADGFVSGEWQPVSPVTGKIDAFEWTTPGIPDNDQGDVLEDSLFEAPALAPAVTKAEPFDRGDAKTVTAEIVTPETSASADVVEPKSATEATAAQQRPMQAASRSGVEGTTDDVNQGPDLHDLPDYPDGAPVAKADAEPVADATPVVTAEGKPQSVSDTEKAEPAAVAKEKEEPKAASKSAKKATADLDKPIEFALARMPDDPGPSEDEADDKSKETPRPRFFN